MVHSSIVRGTGDLVEAITVICEDTEEGCTSRAWTSQNKKLYKLALHLIAVRDLDIKAYHFSRLDLASNILENGLKDM